MIEPEEPGPWRPAVPTHGPGSFPHPAMVRLATHSGGAASSSRPCRPARTRIGFPASLDTPGTQSPQSSTRMRVPGLLPVLVCAALIVAGCASGPRPYSLSNHDPTFSASIRGEYADDAGSNGERSRTGIRWIDGVTVRPADYRDRDLPNQIWMKPGRHSVRLFCLLPNGGSDTERSDLKAECRGAVITAEAGADYLVQAEDDGRSVKFTIVRKGREAVVVWSGWASLETVFRGSKLPHVRVLSR